MYSSLSQNELPVVGLSASFTSSYIYFSDFFCSKWGVAAQDCSEFPKLKIGRKTSHRLSGEHLRVIFLHHPLGEKKKTINSCVVLSVPAVKNCKYELLHGHSLWFYISVSPLTSIGQRNKECSSAWGYLYSCVYSSGWCKRGDIPEYGMLEFLISCSQMPHEDEI